MLFALARRDVHGRGDLAATPSAATRATTRIRVRDGEQDTVNCGEGNDTAFLDFKDRIEDATPAQPNGSCEVVQRARPNRADSVRRTRRRSPAEDQQAS